MRTTIRVLLFFAVFSCTGVPNWIEPPAWPERERVVADSTKLRGQVIKANATGPWLVRATERRAADGGPGSTGRSGREYRGPGDVMPPGAGGPSTPGPGAGASSDDFFMGAGAGPVTGGAATPGGGGGAGGRFGGLAGGAAAAAPLKAGTTDDNSNHRAFIEYLAKQRENGLMKGQCQDLDVADRRVVRVVDPVGRAIAGAEVAVFDGDRERLLWRGTTYGDGAFPFFPKIVGDAARSGTYLLEVGHEGKFMRQHWDGDGELCEVRWPQAIEDPKKLALDVVFLIDTTGSMGDEIARIKVTLASVTTKLQGLDREVDLHYGAVLYRDIGDAYVTKCHPFTGDLAAFDKALQKIQARGGGDSPESLNQGLAVAVDGMKWRDDVAKLVFLIADAAPHMDYEGDVPYGTSLKAAVARGIKVHSVAASGLNAAGSVVFRQVSHFTRGKFIFVEYGANVKASAEKHGVTAPVKSNNLDDILFEQIRDEVATWGRVKARKPA